MTENIEVWAADLLNRPERPAQTQETLVGMGVERGYLVARRVSERASRVFVALLKGKTRKKQQQMSGRCSQAECSRFASWAATGRASARRLHAVSRRLVPIHGFHMSTSSNDGGVQTAPKRQESGLSESSMQACRIVTSTGGI